MTRPSRRPSAARLAMTAAGTALAVAALVGCSAAPIMENFLYDDHERAPYRTESPPAPPQPAPTATEDVPPPDEAPAEETPAEDAPVGGPAPSTTSTPDPRA